MQTIWKFFIGQVSRSAAGSFSRADVLAAARDAAIVAAIVFLQTFDKADFGSAETIVAAGIGLAVSTLRRFAKDYQTV